MSEHREVTVTFNKLQILTQRRSDDWFLILTQVLEDSCFTIQDYAKQSCKCGSVLPQLHVGQVTAAVTT